MNQHREPTELRRYACDKCLAVWGVEVDRYLAEIQTLQERITELENHAENLQVVLRDE
jgi:hypothetical protein